MDDVSHNSIRITSVEISHLWNVYMIESMVHHIVSYYLTHVEDSDIEKFFAVILQETQDSLALLESRFKQENLPIPRGFNSDDIVPGAPRLFSDVYYAIYAKHMARFALLSFVNAYNQSSRSDIRNFFLHYTNRLVIVDKHVTELLQAKGIYTRPPQVSITNKVDFVNDMSFFSGLFGKKRPLTVLEINHLFSNAEANAVGKALLMGFSQVAKSDELRRYFNKGKEIAGKFVGLFDKVLLSEHVAISPSFDDGVTASTVAPFSDRLMLFHVNLLNSAGFGNYGMAFSASPRRDLGLLYVRILLQVAFFSNEGAKLSVKYGWLEQPPSIPARKALVAYNKTKQMVSQPAMKPLDEKPEGTDTE